MILDLLTANPAGLTLAQLREAAGADIASLGALVGDGRVEPCDLGGVDGYRLGKPKTTEPKAKAAPTSRMVPIALLDALALAVNVPLGTSIVDMCHSIEAERATGIANYRALQRRVDAAAAAGVTWTEDADGLLHASVPFACPEVLVERPTLPDGWSATYACDGAKVRPMSRGRWEWAVGPDGEDGSGVCSDLAKAIAKADAVRALS
jgi:hypothetical protein